MTHWILLVKRQGIIAWDGTVMSYVQRRAINTPVRKGELIQVEWMKKGRRRPKLTLEKVVKNDMLIKEVTNSMTLNKIKQWKHAASLDYLKIYNQFKILGLKLDSYCSKLTYQK